MRPNPQKTAGWSHLLKKPLMENFILLCSASSRDKYWSLLKVLWQVLPYIFTLYAETAFFLSFCRNFYIAWFLFKKCRKRTMNIFFRRQEFCVQFSDCFRIDQVLRSHICFRISVSLNLDKFRYIFTFKFWSMFVFL